MSGQESVMMAVRAAIVLWQVTDSLVLRFHFLSSLRNITSVASSAGTSQEAEIIGGGGSGGGWFGVLGVQ